MNNILIVEDEHLIARLIEMTLTRAGYRCTLAEDGRTAADLIETTNFDMALLDIMLPGLDGYALLECLRPQGVPVIFITAKSAVKDRVQGLRLGADDYITKPFGTFELLARIRTAIRHNNKLSDASQNANRPYSADGLTIDFERRLVTLRDQEIHLTRVEYKIVSLLAKNSGKVMTYDTLIDQVWGPYADDNNRILRVNMANIRRKIEENPGEPKYIFTELGVGYRMLEDGN